MINYIGSHEITLIPHLIGIVCLLVALRQYRKQQDA